MKRPSTKCPAALESFFTNLEARGSGETIWSSHLRLNYALYFLETDAAEELVTARTAHGLANEKYTHEDIAARCVDINFAYGDDSQPVIPVLGQIDWEEFDSSPLTQSSRSPNPPLDRSTPTTWAGPIVETMPAFRRICDGQESVARMTRTNLIMRWRRRDAGPDLEAHSEVIARQE